MRRWLPKSCPPLKGGRRPIYKVAVTRFGSTQTPGSGDLENVEVNIYPLSAGTQLGPVRTGATERRVWGRRVWLHELVAVLLETLPKRCVLRGRYDPLL